MVSAQLMQSIVALNVYCVSLVLLNEHVLDTTVFLIHSFMLRHHCVFAMYLKICAFKVVRRSAVLQIKQIVNFQRF